LRSIGALQLLKLSLLCEIVLAPALSLIAVRFSVVWSVVCLSHLCTLQCIPDGFRCHGRCDCVRCGSLTFVIRGDLKVEPFSLNMHLFIFDSPKDASINDFASYEITLVFRFFITPVAKIPGLKNV